MFDLYPSRSFAPVTLRSDNKAITKATQGLMVTPFIVRSVRAFGRFAGLLVIVCFQLSLLTPPASVAYAQQAFQKDDIDSGVSKAIGYLLTQQKPNGSITDRGHENAMTALAIMAMASVGHQPSDPTPEGIAMTRGLRF